MLQQCLKTADTQKFDPVEMLSCRYLRLSKNNVEELTEMCHRASIDVGVHSHLPNECIDLMEYLAEGSSNHASETEIDD